MAACSDEPKTGQSVTSYLGGPYDTRAEAQNAVAAAMHLTARAATTMCVGECADRAESCQLALDDWNPAGVKGPFYATPGGGPGWYFRIPPGASFTYHCECLPKPAPIGGASHAGTSHGGSAHGAFTDDPLAGLDPQAREIYDAMRAQFTPNWHCTPAEWKARYEACRATGSNVAVCAALTSASCFLA